MKHLVLIDLSAIVYRSYFALRYMETSRGIPSGAVFGFVKTMKKLTRELNPDYIAICKDDRRQNLRRREIFKDYKAERKKTPEELVQQFDIIDDFISALNYRSFKVERAEADDTLASLAERFKNECKVTIVTGDKDLLQVVDKNISVCLLKKEKNLIISAGEQVEEKLGVKPSKIPDLFSLIGDKSDGIPGVKGIGPKTAIKLLDQYGTIENVLDNINNIKGVTYKRLVENYETIEKSKQLAIIASQPENFKHLDLEELKVKEPKENYKKLLEKLEFNSILRFI